MFHLLRRLAFYTGLLRTTGVASKGVRAAFKATIDDLSSMIWHRFDWDPEETALRRFPIYVEACRLQRRLELW